MQKFSIKKVCERTGVNPNTLRTWERRYGLIQPQRTASGHRYYSEQEIEKIRVLAQLVFEGHAVSHLKDLKFDELCARLQHQPDIVAQEVPDLGDVQWAHVSQVLQKILDHLEKFELAEVSRLVESCVVRLSPRELVLQIVSPLMGDIGARVQQGLLSVAQEHALSAIVKFELFKVLGQMRNKGKKEAPLVLLSTPQGDFHEFGILVSAILCSFHGCRVQYLGPNMPTEAIEHLVHSLNPDILLLGTVNRDDEVVQTLKTELEKLVTAYPSVEFWLGGSTTLDLSIFKERTNFQVVNNFRNLEALVLKRLG